MVAQVIVDVVHTNVARPFSYLIPEGMQVVVGLRVLVPLGRRQVDGFVVDLIEDHEADVPKEKLKPISKALDDYPALLPPLLELAQEMALESHCPLSETLRLMLPAAMRTGRIQMKKALYAQLVPGVDALKEAERQKRAPKRATLLRLLSDGQEKAVSELAQLVNDPRDALRTLEKAGLVKLSEREIFRAPDGVEAIERTLPPPLTGDQREALDTMLPALREGRGSFLLHGVTGSGKTEVYLAMVNEALKQGKVDAVIIDSEPAEVFVSKNDDIEILNEPFAKEDYAIAIKLDNTELQEKINGALAELEADGTLANIRTNYRGDTKGTIPYVSPEGVDRSNGKLVMATNAEFPPYEYKENDKIVG